MCTCGLTETARLVRDAQAGDRTAFAGLYSRFVRAVHGVVLSRVPWIDVEDVVQDVFMIALQRLTSLRDQEAFAGWILQIARNRAIDQLRRAPPRTELPEELAGPVPHRVEAIAALAAIRNLPAAYRETMVLRLVEGMTGPEIAEQTGLTPGSVRVNLHRGMMLLRDQLKGVNERRVSVGSDRPAGS